MVVNHKVTGTASSMAGGLAVGWLIGLLLTIAGSVLSALLILKEMIGESSIGYCVMFIVVIASALSAGTAVQRVKRRRAYVCILSGLLYYGTLLSMTALFFGGQYHGMGVTALLVAAGCGTVLLLGLKGEGRGTRKKYRSSYC